MCVRVCRRFDDILDLVLPAMARICKCFCLFVFLLLLFIYFCWKPTHLQCIKCLEVVCILAVNVCLRSTVLTLRVVAGLHGSDQIEDGHGIVGWGRGCGWERRGGGGGFSLQQRI